MLSVHSFKQEVKERRWKEQRETENGEESRMESRRMLQLESIRVVVSA